MCGREFCVFWCAHCKHQTQHTTRPTVGTAPFIPAVPELSEQGCARTLICPGMRRSGRLVQLCSRQVSIAAQASAVHAVDAHAVHAQLHHSSSPLAAAATSSSYHDSRSHQHASPWALPAISLGAAAALLAAQTSSSKAEAPVGKVRAVHSMVNADIKCMS